MESCIDLLVVLLLVCRLAGGQDLPQILSKVVSVQNDGDSCSSGDRVEEARTEVEGNINAVVRETLTYHNPVPSCTGLPEDYGSGYYWIKASDSVTATRQYCDMNRTCCNSRRGWTRVANLDMTDPSQQCPSGLAIMISPKRSCGRPSVTGFKGCVSTTFPVHGVEYSRVCGRVIGYQQGTPDGFASYFSNPTTVDIDGIYLDGVSLTHDSSPRKHIWSFVCALDETRSDFPVCPCTHPDMPYTGTIPPFVGQDYFCETGSREQSEPGRLYFEDPLWDRQGCGEVSTCCNHPLYFCKQLDQPTRDDIELRVCANSYSRNEDTKLEIIEIYVQ